MKVADLDVASFGTEVIQRLQEIYYSNQSDSILKKTGQTLETLEAEFLDRINLEAVMGIIIRREEKNYLYLARNGAGQVWLKRADQVVPLFAKKQQAIEVLCGEFKPGDRLLLATADFCRIIAQGEIQAGLNSSLEAGGESLSTIIHGHEDNSRAAGVLTEEKEEKVVKVEKAVKAEKVNKLWQKIKPKLALKIKLQETSRGRRSTATALLILLLIFIISLFLTGRKKQLESAQKNSQTVAEEVKYKYSEAESLLKLNPLRARSLLTEAQASLNEYQQKSKKELTGEMKELSDKINAALGGARREYRFDSATEWFNFDLTKDGFRGSDWAIEGDKLWVLDSNNQTMIELNLNNRSSRVVAGADQLSGAKLVAFTADRGFVISDSGVTVIDKNSTASVAADGWGKIADAVGFGSNLYLLDQSNPGQVWKYLGIPNGLSGKREYLKLKNPDLSEAVSLAVDGSVWLLFSDGTIAKYIQGAKEPFMIAGLDKNLEQPIKIFTNTDNDNLYILDYKQTRVVVLSKTGEYQAQYIWPGLAGARDMVVSESLQKMFFLTGQKIFTLDLR